jgi:hypothetical protein
MGRWGLMLGLLCLVLLVVVLVVVLITTRGRRRANLLSRPPKAIRANVGIRVRACEQCGTPVPTGQYCSAGGHGKTVSSTGSPGREPPPNRPPQNLGSGQRDYLHITDADLTCESPKEPSEPPSSPQRLRGETSRAEADRGPGPAIRESRTPMSESSSIADKLKIEEGEQVLTKFEVDIKLQIKKGGILGKKWLLGDEQSTVPVYMLVTDRRLIFVSEYTTQKRMVVALVIPVPTGKKKSHTLYGELAGSAFQGIETGWTGGAKLTFRAHGALQRQFRKHSYYVLHLPGMNKKGVAALEQVLTSARSSAPALPNSGRCELD